MPDIKGHNTWLQLQSPLFQLPQELRDIVYDYVLALGRKETRNDRKPPFHALGHNDERNCRTPRFLRVCRRLRHDLIHGANPEASTRLGLYFHVYWTPANLSTQGPRRTVGVTTPGVVFNHKRRVTIVLVAQEENDIEYSRKICRRFVSAESLPTGLPPFESVRNIAWTTTTQNMSNDWLPIPRYVARMVSELCQEEVTVDLRRFNLTELNPIRYMHFMSLFRDLFLSSWRQVSVLGNVSEFHRKEIADKMYEAMPKKRRQTRWSSEWLVFMNDHGKVTSTYDIRRLTSG